MALTPEDRREIRTLYARYAFAIDLGTADEWADCFTAEGSFHIYGKTHQGRAGLLAFAAPICAKPARGRHWISNLVIEEAPAGSGAGLTPGSTSTASGRAYVSVMRLTATPRIADVTGVYEDKLVKTERGWKFASRNAVLDA